MTHYYDRLQAGDYTPAPNAEDLEAQTVADLKNELSNRGLPTTGNKQELIERLATEDNE